MTNLLFCTDSYKYSHFAQYEQGMTKMFSYIESRGGEYGHTVFFGMQYLLKEYLSKGFTASDIEEAAEFATLHGVPFPKEQFLKMHARYDRGSGIADFPVSIKAPREGSKIPTKNVLVTIESTDDEFPWIVSFLETVLLRIWYPITVATRSWHCKQVILDYLKQTSDDPYGEIAFKLHDFGARGASSSETATIGGMAHLVNFMGSDTIEGVIGCRKYYDEKIAAFSIPAAEHSTITSWGRDRECNAYANMIEKFAKPGALFAVVSDSYSLWHAVSVLWGKELKEQVIKSGATLVVRPDSGVPHEVVLKTIELLEASFGCSINSKGYKVLNHVRVIQGDGVNMESIGRILETLKKNGYSASNVAFGMGGHLLQQMDRDTLRFAMKCSSVVVNGKERNVSKDPITDPGKRSKEGVLDLVRDEKGSYKTVLRGSEHQSALHEVYRNGVIDSQFQLFSDVRKLAAE
jgi:nicotinamide phosphoribosyltransferase